MIAIEMKGRLGNQMFRYACARKLQIERGGADELVLGFSSMRGLDPSQGWKDSLQDFNTAPYRRSDKKIAYSEGSLAQSLALKAYYLDAKVIRKTQDRLLFLKRQQQWAPLFTRLGMVVSDNNDFLPDLGSSKDIILDGLFENTRFFDSIRSTLLREFTPRHAPVPANAQLLERIHSTESVCISFRRGDFISNAGYKDIFDVCGPEYYRKAVEEIKKRVENPVFFLFSDEIDWVIENVRIDGECHYETGTDPQWEKLRLMSSCKHFIIPNSTFAWWAQYLGTAQDKTVIAPSRWYNDARPSFLLTDDMIKIEV